MHIHGTLLEAWASLKSFRPRDKQEPPADGGRNPERDFHERGDLTYAKSGAPARLPVGDGDEDLHH